MFSFFKKIFIRKKKYRVVEIDPDEIFLDSENLPNFDRYQFEGRIEKPISKKTAIASGIIFVLIALSFLGKIWALEVEKGDEYSAKAERNRLRHSPLFAERGVIYDRNNVLLAWNEPGKANPDISERKYYPVSGISNLLGYVKYPSTDSSGFYYKEDFEGVDGLEKKFNGVLRGRNGQKIIETDALGKIQSESETYPPENGQSIRLSIDVLLQEKMFEIIKKTAENAGFEGGAGLLMDAYTGELLVSASYPEYDSNILTEGKDAGAIKGFVESKKMPFLNRAIDGLYTPGSIVKPFVALGVLNEKIISPEKTILSTGSISIPNPYDPEKKSVFTDWKAHGEVDMRKALAVSSNVYFYEVGGGFENQKGLGIKGIKKYMEMFGFGFPAGEDPFVSKEGTIPDPEWKKEKFDGEEWRIGDTYNTSIGQYGFQVTPLQMAKGAGAIANGGKLQEPSILALLRENSEAEEIPIPEGYFQIIREGMRRGVLEGTAKGLDIREVKVAAKTGTAELGSAKKMVNSWVIGFFPYENPRYAFAVIMERGPRENTIGGLYVMRQFLEWMASEIPEYFK